MSDLISRQVAIDEISQYASIWMEYDDTMSLEEVAEAALKAAKRTMVHILEELPSAQPSFSQPHENDRSAEVNKMGDLISRRAAIDALNDEITVTGKANAIVVQDYIRRVNLRLHDLPSAQSEQVRAMWIVTTSLQEGQITWRDYKCSNCSHHREKPMNFCEVCGAKMER